MKLRLRKLPIARRLVQCGVLALLLIIPTVSRYANYVAAYDIDKSIEKWDGTLQGEALFVMDQAFRALPKGEKERVGQMVRDRTGVLSYTQNFRGGPWSIEIAGLSMSDPLAAAESIVARRHFERVMMISLIVPVILTLLFGRVFCSWICPMGLFLELTDKLRALMRFLELRPRNVAFSPYTKYALLGAGLVVTAFMAQPILAYIYPPAIINREAHDLVFGIFDRAEEGHFGFWAGGLTWMSLILVAIAAFEVFVSRRWWCRYVCPGGALYAILGVARPVRVKLLTARCTTCADCIVVCPMGLNPMADKMGIECDNCGLCISSCDDKALKFALPGGTGVSPVGTMGGTTPMPLTHDRVEIETSPLAK